MVIAGDFNASNKEEWNKLQKEDLEGTFFRTINKETRKENQLDDILICKVIRKHLNGEILKKVIDVNYSDHKPIEIVL